MQIPWLPSTRIVRGALGATISHQFTDSDGAVVDPTGSGGGAVTVAVTRSTGASVTVGAVTGSGSDARAVTVGLDAVAEVDWLTAVWSIGGNEVATDVVEVVGGVLMSQTDAAAIDRSLGEAALDPARFRKARLATEDTITSELHRSPFERFYTERLPGTGTARLWVSWPDVLEVKWAKVWVGTTSTSLTSTELAAIKSPAGSMIERTDGNVWPCNADIELGYRFGMRSLPTDLAENLVLAIRHHVKKFDAGLPFLGQTLELAEGGVMRQNRPGVGASITGNDELDARIRSNRYRPPLIR